MRSRWDTNRAKRAKWKLFRCTLVYDIIILYNTLWSISYYWKPERYRWYIISYSLPYTLWQSLIILLEPLAIPLLGNNLTLNTNIKKQTLNKSNPKNNGRKSAGLWGCAPAAGAPSADRAVEAYDLSRQAPRRLDMRDHVRSMKLSARCSRLHETFSEMLTLFFYEYMG